jgi:hypothetical protein
MFFFAGIERRKRRRKGRPEDYTVPDLVCTDNCLGLSTSIKGHRGQATSLRSIKWLKWRISSRVLLILKRTPPKERACLRLSFDVQFVHKSPEDTRPTLPSKLVVRGFCRKGRRSQFQSIGTVFYVRNWYIHIVRHMNNFESLFALCVDHVEIVLEIDWNSLVHFLRQCLQRGHWGQNAEK